jgi:F-type H+-transporting ATPase subunit b
MNQLLTSFGVDWKLLLAQMVNFAILLYVLKRFAYTPLLKMLQDRQDIVRKGLEDAQNAEKSLNAAHIDAQAIHEDARKKALALLEDTNTQGKLLINQAKEQGNAEKDHILKSAEKTIADMQEKSDYAVKEKAVEHIMSTVRSILGEEIDSSMNSRIIQKLTA